MKKKKILVVMGGKSKERQISLSSGKQCLKAIKKLGYQTSIFDPKKKEYNKKNIKNPDIIFNALHGAEGEDGIAQSYFEYLKIPYTHSGVISSMLAMNKHLSKKIFTKNNIKTPNYLKVTKKNFSNNKVFFQLKKNKIKFPVVVKPISEGSSIGVKISENKKDFLKNIKRLFHKYNELLIETFIGGKEIQVAVLNDKALGAIELRPKRKFYDYKAKYTKSAKTDHIMPADLDKKKYNEVLKISEKAHKLLNCRGVSRSDFKYYKNHFYILELNTQPGMTNLSLVPEIAAYKGINFENLVEKIIKDSSINK